VRSTKDAKTAAEEMLEAAYREREASAKRRTRFLTRVYPELSSVRATHMRSILNDARQRAYRERPVFVMSVLLVLGVISILLAWWMGWEGASSLFWPMAAIIAASQVVHYAVTRRLLRETHTR
jgi:hypothetical protein